MKALMDKWHVALLSDALTETSHEDDGFAQESGDQSSHTALIYAVLSSGLLFPVS